MSYDNQNISYFVKEHPSVVSLVAERATLKTKEELDANQEELTKLILKLVGHSPNKQFRTEREKRALLKDAYNKRIYTPAPYEEPSYRREGPLQLVGGGPLPDDYPVETIPF